jgi:hypothetical protein
MSAPRRQGDNIPRNNWRGIIGITEYNEYCTASPGGRTLALYDQPWTRATGPGYHFSTYATNKNNNNMFKDMTYEDQKDLDGSWNWVYFGYSMVE